MDTADFDRRLGALTASLGDATRRGIYIAARESSEPQDSPLRLSRQGLHRLATGDRATHRRGLRRDGPRRRPCHDRHRIRGRGGSRPIPPDHQPLPVRRHGNPVPRGGVLARSGVARRPHGEARPEMGAGTLPPLDSRRGLHNRGSLLTLPGNAAQRRLLSASYPLTGHPGLRGGPRWIARHSAIARRGLGGRPGAGRRRWPTPIRMGLQGTGTRA